MARGKLPAKDEFHDSGYRFRRLKRGEAGKAFSVFVRMPADDEHDDWWWSKPKKITLGKPDDKTQLLSLADAYREELTTKEEVPSTVSEYIEHWKERRGRLVKSGKKKQSTIDREKTTLRYIDDYMGDMLIAEMTAAAISNVYAKMEKDGISASTCARAHVKLRQLLKQAVRDRIIEENPIDDMDEDDVPHMPQRDAGRYAERQVTIDEADKLMSELKGEPKSGLHAAVWLSYMLGLRRGECLGLRWSDIDEKAMTVRIQRQMTRDGVDTTKTYRSTRTLPLTQPVWRYLLSWRDEQIKLYSEPLKHRNKFGLLDEMVPTTWTPEVFVCTNADGWPWKLSGNFNRGIRNFFVAHGLGEWIVDDNGKRHYHGATMHSLRHTYATSLIRDKVDVVSAQALLGHAQVTTTLQVYADATMDGMREAAVAHAMHVADERDTGLYTEEDMRAYEAFEIEELRERGELPPSR